MQDFLLYESTRARCPHGGKVVFKSGFNKVWIENIPLVTTTDQFTIIGCGNSYSPCTTVKWNTFSNKILVNRHPVITKSNLGMCFGGTPGFVRGITTQDIVIGS